VASKWLADILTAKISSHCSKSDLLQRCYCCYYYYFWCLCTRG